MSRMRVRVRLLSGHRGFRTPLHVHFRKGAFKMSMLGILVCLLASVFFPAAIGAQSANKREPPNAAQSKVSSLCNEGATVCVPENVENSLISVPLDITVSVKTSGQTEISWEVTDSTGQILESGSTSDYRFPVQSESQTRKTLRIRDYFLRPPNSNTGTLILSPSRLSSSGGSTKLSQLKIPVRLDTTRTILTVVLPANHDEFAAAVAEWVDDGQQGELAFNGPLVSQTVTVMHLRPADVVGATAEAAVRAWPSQGTWHVIDSSTVRDTARVTLNGDGWMGVTYYLAEAHFIITKSLLQLPAVKHVKFDEVASE